MERKLSKTQIAARKWKRELAVQLSIRKSHRPVKGDELRSRWGKSRGYLVKVIADLILNDGEKIGSCHRGYFPILRDEDLQVAVDFLRDRGFRLLLRCAILSGRHVEKVFEEAWKDSWNERFAGTESVRVRKSAEWKQ